MCVQTHRCRSHEEAQLVDMGGGVESSIYRRAIQQLNIRFQTLTLKTKILSITLHVKNANLQHDKVYMAFYDSLSPDGIHNGRRKWTDQLFSWLGTRKKIFVRRQTRKWIFGLFGNHDRGLSSFKGEALNCKKRKIVWMIVLRPREVNSIQLF
uniref:Uncharacterized protein n=1 Tax=Strigamia maritima TaxID=126957 RepID=T1IW55_STRMM